MLQFSVLDSTSRHQTGILMGNNIDLGNFDECLDSKYRANRTLKTQYCLIIFQMDIVKRNEALTDFYGTSVYDDEDNRNITLGFSVCMPETCSETDIKNSVENASKINNKKFTKIDLMCTKKGNQVYSAGDLLLT